MLVLGREVDTPFGGRIDILALDCDGSVVIIECKRDRTPRDVIAQILDYASWVNDLTGRELENIALKKKGKQLGQLFQDKFGTALPDALNKSHSLVIVSSEFDASSRRIVEYLAEVHDISINAAFFTTFDHESETLIATEWMMDQDEVVQRAADKTKVAWSGLWYVNVGHGGSRSWEDMRRYGFLAAGGGRKYSDPLRKLKVGDPVLAYQPEKGYVGYGRITSDVLTVGDFRIDGKSILEEPLEQPGLAHDADSPDLGEYLVGIKWEKTFPLSEGKTFVGIFANQNIVCKLRDSATLSFLERQFPIKSDPDQTPPQFSNR